MARIKTKDLKHAFLFRVYSDEEYDFLKQAIAKNRDKFDSLNDCIKYLALTGADKVLGDGLMNNNFNFTEIRKYMEQVDTKLEDLKGLDEFNHKDIYGEILTLESLVKFLINMLVEIKDYDFYKHSERWKYSYYDEDELERVRTENKYKVLNERNKPNA